MTQLSFFDAGLSDPELRRPGAPELSEGHRFKVNDLAVYPPHGVGRIVGIEKHEIAGKSVELFVMNFDQQNMTLQVPIDRIRKLSDDGILKKAMDTLEGRPRIKHTKWSRRAKEYVAKINSGDLISIAEVVRDLYRSEAQWYSEHQLCEDALHRWARELAAVEKLDERAAHQRITDVLREAREGRRTAEELPIPLPRSFRLRGTGPKFWEAGAV